MLVGLGPLASAAGAVATYESLSFRWVPNEDRIERTRGPGWCVPARRRRCARSCRGRHQRRRVAARVRRCKTHSTSSTHAGETALTHRIRWGRGAVVDALRRRTRGRRIAAGRPVQRRRGVQRHGHADGRRPLRDCKTQILTPHITPQRKRREEGLAARMWGRARWRGVRRRRAGVRRGRSQRRRIAAWRLLGRRRS